jgi:hypothetical protein
MNNCPIYQEIALSQLSKEELSWNTDQNLIKPLTLS